MSRLVVGTANFNQCYGLKNKNRQVDTYEVKKILNYAYASGIEYIDTAVSYGETKDNRFKIITKTTGQRPPNYDIVLAHGFQYFNNNLDGVSVDNIEQAIIYAEAFKIKAIQIPYNIFNCKISNTTFFETTKRKGIKVFTRSVFLQGLILMDNPLIGKEYIDKLDSIIRPYEVSRKEAAFLFVYNNPDIDYVVVGVDSVKNLKELVEMTDKKLPEKLIQELKESFQDVPDKIKYPWLWEIK